MSRPWLIFAAAMLAATVSLADVRSACAQGMRTDLTKALARGLGAMDRLSTNGGGGRRYGVVVGNNSYAHIENLNTAVNDAKLVADFLRDQNFTVFEAFDVDKRHFERMLRMALLEFDPDSEVLFYYAGHGIQIGRQNYLLPTDVTLQNVHDVPFETVMLDQLLALLASRSRLQLAILDSCRENPFARMKLVTGLDSTLFETGSGFSMMSTPLNTLLAFSTSPGSLALDGLGGMNSPFTSAFVQSASAGPTESITRILEEVRQRVYKDTGGRQIPWESSTLVEPFRFRSATANVGPLNALAPVLGAQSSNDAAIAPPNDAQTVASDAHAADPKNAQHATAKAEPTATGAAELQSGPTTQFAQAQGGALPALERPKPVRIQVELDRVIEIGPLVAAELSAPLTTNVRVSASPRNGSLVFSSEGGVHADVGGALGGLAYDLMIAERSALDGGAEPIKDAFTLLATLQGRDVKVDVDLTASINPCDAEAGDWLDPDGVGIARYPNEIEPEVALAACRAAVNQAPDSGRFRYQLGRALLALRQLDDAEAAFDKARELGHIRAWHALGDIKASADLLPGADKTKSEPSKALPLYAAGVENGDVYSMHALGKQLLRHGQTDTERTEGYTLLSRAVEIGHTFAMNELGYHFIRERSEDYQPQRGLKYLMTSAERGDIYGFNNLGLVYLRGLAGVSPDAAAARDWFVKASEGGHPNAPANLGRMYFNGLLGDRPDLGAAIAWYDKGLERGDAWGGANAAWIIFNRKVKGFDRVDAAIRSAKASTLRAKEAGRQADNILRKLDAAVLNRATQRFLNDLGGDVVEDGLFGRKTLEAIKFVAAENQVAPDVDSPIARLKTMARIYWRSNPLRIDLH